MLKSNIINLHPEGSCPFDKGSHLTPYVPGKSSLRYSTMHIINQSRACTCL